MDVRVGFKASEVGWLWKQQRVGCDCWDGFECEESEWCGCIVEASVQEVRVHVCACASVAGMVCWVCGTTWVWVRIGCVIEQGGCA
jgi:hypothetical protein